MVLVKRVEDRRPHSAIATGSPKKAKTRSCLEISLFNCNIMLVPFRRLPLQQRRWLAAATSRQKRALDPEQLVGNKPTASPPTPSATSSDASSAVSSSNLLAAGVAGLAVVGGGIYYFTRPSEVPVAVAAPTLTPTTAEQPTTKPTTDAAEAIPNKVRSIQVPEKMKNAKSTLALAVPSHPVTGNRVVGIVRPSAAPIQTATISDPSLTNRAIAQLKESESQATEAVLKSHQSLWSTMDQSFFQDLDALTPSQLKARIVQLATEMKDRTKWEAVRLKEFLAMKEKETAEK